VVIVGTRDYRLELALGMGAEHAFNVSDSGSQYYSEDLAASIKGVNAGELADKAIVATASEEATQGALEVTGNGSTIVYMGLAGPDDTVKLPMLSSLAMDKTIRFSWLYPNQWPNTIRLLREGIVDTSRIITHSIALDEIDAGIRQVVARDDGVIKIIVKP
jgi:threonine dehydrogenase-like Zn-dependent dehydrogenase